MAAAQLARSAHPGDLTIRATLAGINIGGTTTSVVGGCEDGRILTRWSAPTAAHDAERLVREVAEAVARVAPDVNRVGIAVGGPLDAHRGRILDAPHLPGLRGIDLRDRIAAATGKETVLHHDAAACALAEWRWGPDRGARGIAYLTCGTGFGTGLVLDGRARYGSDGRSCEIGHVRYAADGPAMFDKPGCFEGYASAKALALLAVWRRPARFADVLPNDVVTLAAAGDHDAAWAVAANQAAVAASCALLADLLALDVIVLGSLAGYLGPTWVDGVRAAYEAEVLPINRRTCRVRGAMDDVQDRSGLAAAFDSPSGTAGRAR